MRRDRRNRHYSDENTDRWMISYADFITLLFAFFVVMYAISSVNEGKYRAVAETLRTNFGKVPAVGNARLDDAGALAVQTTAPPGENVIPLPAPVDPATLIPKPEPRSEAATKQSESPKRSESPGNTLESMARDLRGVLGGLIEDGKVALTQTSRGLEVEINSRLLFASASSKLNEEYRPLISRIAAVLQDRTNAVDVEGFTDDRPIYTPRFPSNWELSAARAAAVIRLLVEHGVTPGRLAAVGYGPYRSVATNETAAGRAKNRRVVLVIRASERKLPTVSGDPS